MTHSVSCGTKQTEENSIIIWIGWTGMRAWSDGSSCVMGFWPALFPLLSDIQFSDNICWPVGPKTASLIYLLTSKFFVVFKKFFWFCSFCATYTFKEKWFTVSALKQTSYFLLVCKSDSCSKCLGTLMAIV